MHSEVSKSTESKVEEFKKVIENQMHNDDKDSFNHK